MPDSDSWFQFCSILSRISYSNLTTPLLGTNYPTSGQARERSFAALLRYRTTCSSLRFKEMARTHLKSVRPNRPSMRQFYAPLLRMSNTLSQFHELFLACQEIRAEGRGQLRRHTVTGSSSLLKYTLRLHAHIRHGNQLLVSTSRIEDAGAAEFSFEQPVAVAAAMR